MPDPILVLKALLLLLAANGSPVLGKRLLGDRLAIPLDGGLNFLDGRPLLGASKTVRGLVLSLATTAIVAVLLGFSWQLGVGFAAASMAGDLISSFTKRRLNVPPSGQALGLDQIPEALLPLWLFREPLGFDCWDIILLTSLFIVGELVLSKLMYRLGIRDQPY
jgi:CDP-2,3-bis-(O-geranylgeranyl)-sn-glycerol synthase